jgi:hypothetical protein
MTTMFIYEGNGENIPTETEAYYETVASQEEIYLEETEEELRMILESDNPLPAPNECPNNVSSLKSVSNLSTPILMILHSANRQSRKCLDDLNQRFTRGMCLRV